MTDRDKNHWKNKETLTNWIESVESEEQLDEIFFNLYEISQDELTPAPYWIEINNYCMDDNVYCQYIDGYWEPKHYGDIITIDEKKYIYIDSLALPEEQEHQAEDGSLVYEYRGPSFLRILYLINLDPEFLKGKIEDEQYLLMQEIRKESKAANTSYIFQEMNFLMGEKIDELETLDDIQYFLKKYKDETLEAPIKNMLAELPNFKEIEGDVNRLKNQTMETWLNETARIIVNDTKK